MKKLLLCLTLVVLGVTSLSCATGQESKDVIESTTPISALFDTEIASTGIVADATETLQLFSTPTRTPEPIVTKTLLPYWGTSVSSQFEGRWVVYGNQDFGFSFTYPQPHDSNPCGKLIFNEHTHVSQLNFEKGGILIMFSRAGNPGDLDDYARNYPRQLNRELISAVERFFIGGISAVRFIYDNQSSYTKKAFVTKNGILYDFSFRLGNYSNCDVPELPEEQVYETIISTWEFLK